MPDSDDDDREPAPATRRSRIPAAITPSSGPGALAHDDLPVVARLIIEVRSDGSRTVARGAMEDAASGTKAAIEAVGNTPLELALGLAKSLLSAPWMKTISKTRLRGLLKK
jgi:hypothetical protein